MKAQARSRVGFGWDAIPFAELCAQGGHDGGAPQIADPALRWAAGLAVAGLFIGMVVALLGVAGGELLIPSIWLLTGLGAILLVSAVKVFQHTQEQKQP